MGHAAFYMVVTPNALGVVHVIGVMSTAAVFASEPLTEDGEGWLPLEYGSMMFLAKQEDGRITRSVRGLALPGAP